VINRRHQATMTLLAEDLAAEDWEFAV
jgi:hypothetical protein